MDMKSPFLFLSLLLFVAACGDSGKNDQSTQHISPEVQYNTDPQTGYFLDSAVEGLSYYTSGGADALTDAEGKFTYFFGDRIDFKIGNIELGFIQTDPVRADAVVLTDTFGATIVTPVTLVGDSENSDDQRVINRLVFLQTLDEDGDPGNGIVINQATRDAAQDLVLDFDIPTQDFISGPFKDFVEQLNTSNVFTENMPRAVRSEIAALCHFGDLKPPGSISLGESTTQNYSAWWLQTNGCTEIGKSTISIRNTSVTFCPNTLGMDGCFEGVVRSNGDLQFPKMPRNGLCATTGYSINGEFYPIESCVDADTSLLTASLNLSDKQPTGTYEASCNTNQANIGEKQSISADFFDAEGYSGLNFVSQRINNIIGAASCNTGADCETLILSGTQSCSLRSYRAYAPASVNMSELNLYKYVYSQIRNEIESDQSGLTICSVGFTPDSICTQNQCRLDQ